MGGKIDRVEVITSVQRRGWKTVMDGPGPTETVVAITTNDGGEEEATAGV